MFKYYSSYALVYSTFIHLLCCGIPIFVSLNSIFTNLVLFETLAFNLEFLETLEVFLFMLTSTIFFSLIALEIYNKKIKCTDNECCTDQECDSTKKKIRFNIIFSSTLYVLNSTILLSEIFF